MGILLLELDMACYEEVGVVGKCQVDAVEAQYGCCHVVRARYEEIAPSDLHPHLYPEESCAGRGYSGARQAGGVAGDQAARRLLPQRGGQGDLPTVARGIVCLLLH